MGYSDSEDEMSDLDYEENSYDVIIKELPLNKFYTALDNDNHNDYTPRLCSGLENSSSEDKEPFAELCKKIEFKLKHLSHIKDQCNGVPDEQVCEYFNYWLGNEIYKIGFNSNSISGIAHACNLGYTALASKKCSYIPDKFKNKDFKKMKEFFDYTENLEAIDKMAKEFTVLNDVFYCDYINKAVKAYNEIKIRGTCEDNSCAYINEFRVFKEKYNTYYNSLNAKCFNKIQCLMNSKGGFEPPCVLKSDKFSKDQLIGAQLLQSEDDNHMSITNVSIASVCTVLLIGFFLLFLYKFTPFGSSLNQLIRKGIIKKETIDEETRYTFLHNSENKGLNFDDSKYNIAYNSL
ncbi:PIR Superfamily Protein [Plasmodium ovale wallikeri]|uniref:PIR Superfamily Protein n=1 Tax=Plasmodium ovale wallikeri TaxID=864142 RepID=A0A1A9ATC8_PLAOA|nr:PIR Superfamily Protein [Plasmodium ovale wallikeri]